MATTVTAANLSVTITENVSLGNRSWGNNQIKTFTSQGEVDQRIMSIAYDSGRETGDWTDIIYLDTVDDRGQVVAANFGYFRITNLDDTNYIVLQLYMSAAKSLYFKVEAGESFVLMSPDADALCEAGIPTLADIARIRAVADTAAVDIEYLVVTTGAAV